MSNLVPIRRLEGWLTIAEAGDVLGLSKQGMHRALFNAADRRFNLDQDVRGIGDKPTIVIREEAVEAERLRRAALEEQRHADESPAVTRTRRQVIR